MAIDYIIDYDCVPKQEFGTQELLERLKGEERAHTIIELFRKNGDERPPSEMGFEFTRRTPEGDDENRVVVVQDLLDAADELKNVEGYCQGCPANHTGERFGCIGYIQYPVTEYAERWLLSRLPVPDDMLVWWLLKQVVEEFKYDGASIDPMRQMDQQLFETSDIHSRQLGELTLNANQVFEMLFGRRGYIMPRQAVLLLLFVNAIDRSDLEADEIKALEPAPADASKRYPFNMEPSESDDRTVSEIKGFFHALYMAWTLNVNLLLDV